MKEVMVHMYIEKQNRFPYLSFAHVFLILWRKAEIIYVWWLLGITKMAGHSYPVSLGVPRWRPCQIPDPGQRLNVKIPTQGEALSVNFPWVARPPPPWGLTLIGALSFHDLLLQVMTFGHLYSKICSLATGMPSPKTPDRSFSLSRNKKNKLETVQFKKPRNWNVIKD